MVAIGIDLGTTYSSVGVFQHGKVEIIANDQGNRATPSYVAFTDSERLIGDAAKIQEAMNPLNTAFNAKRMIGRKYDDDKMWEDIKHWSLSAVISYAKARFVVELKDDQKLITPEQISSMVLAKLKEAAEAYLGTTVKDAVITVPAYFNDYQRQATKDAGVIAGFNVLQIINEPTAAALAYGLDKNLKGQRNVLIFDLGGGTFDISILTIDEGTLFEVRATAGDTQLGGEDFDLRLVNHFAEEFKGKHKKDLRSNPQAVRRLRTAAEQAKRTLSSSTEATIEIDALYEGVDFYTKISRSHFEEMCGDLFLSTLDTVEKALNDAKMDKSQIHDIVLVGGSTRIPKVQSLLQTFFGEKSLNLSINPDEVVAYGAAIQAAILSGDKSSQIQGIHVVDITPFSLEVKTEDGVMTKLFERNTRIPSKLIKTFTTVQDYQRIFIIELFENERGKSDTNATQVFENDNEKGDTVKNNNLMDTFTIYRLTRELIGVPKIEITFNLDANGILNVSAMEMTNGNVKKLRYQRELGRLKQSDIDYIMDEAKEYAEEKEEERQGIVARNQLESYVIHLKQADCEASSKLSQSDKDHLLEKCKETVKWLNANTTAEKEEYEYKLKKLIKICRPIIAKIHQLEGDCIPQLSNGGKQSSNYGGGNYGEPTVEEVD